LIIAVLSRHRAVGGQDFVSLPGDLGKIARRDELLERGLSLAELSLRLRQCGPRLGYLLIQVRGLDIGQLLARLHAIADIDIALFSNSRLRGRNICFRDGRDVPWQHQLSARAARSPLRRSLKAA